MSHEIGSIKSISKATIPEELGLQSLAKAVCAERIRKLETQAREEVKQIQGRQARMRFLNKAIRTVNGGEAEKNGDVQFEKNEEIKKLLDEFKDVHCKYEGIDEDCNETIQERIDHFNNEAENLKVKAEQLIEEAEGDDEASNAEKLQQAAQLNNDAKALEDKAAELQDMYKVIKDLENKEKLTKEEKGKLIDNFRSCFDDLNQINQLQVQTATHLNSERHETLLMARMIMKTLHDDIVHKARAASGRG